MEARLPDSPARLLDDRASLKACSTHGSHLSSPWLPEAQHSSLPSCSPTHTCPSQPYLSTLRCLARSCFLVILTKPTDPQLASLNLSNLPSSVVLTAAVSPA